MAEKEAAPATSDAMVCCVYPDFCVRAGQTVAFDIHALESDDVKHSTDVQITGDWASNADSRLSAVRCDGPADAGINSGVVEGFARPVADMAETVLVNGRPCVRHDTEFEMNCAGPDGPFNTKGKMVYDRGPGGAPLDANGEPTAPTDPPLSAEDQAKLAADDGGFWQDGYGYDLKNQAGNFWDGFSRTVNGALDTAVSAGKVGAQFGAFLYQDATGQDPSLIFDESELAAGEAAIGGTAQGVVSLATDPIGTLTAAYDGSVSAFTDAFERIAAGEAATLAGELSGSGAIALASGGAGAAVGRLRGVGGLLGKARKAGNLDELIDSGALNRIPDDQLRQLRDAGHLSDAELKRIDAKKVEEADAEIKRQQDQEAAEAADDKDGVLVHKKSASEVYDESDVAPEDKYDGETHRGDNRTPEEMRAAGKFEGTDPNAKISAEQHLMKDRPGSQFVSTTKDVNVAEHYATIGDGSGRGGLLEIAASGKTPQTFIYHINQSGGIDLDAISALARTTGNLEVAFTQIPFSSVTGWTRIQVIGGQIVRTFEANPSYIPPGG